MAIVENISSEIGDVLRIRTNVPIVGVVSLYSFLDGTQGETGTRFFTKEFRYSTDGGTNFTAWQELTSINVQGITVNRKDLFVIEYKYQRSGSDNTGELQWDRTALDGEIIPLAYPHYNRSVFAKFFDVNDVDVLRWAINVLEKMYQSGYVPAYITRNSDEDFPLTEDADFLTFFGGITHFFAILVRFARMFEDFSNIPELQRRFILSRGIIPPFDEDPEQMNYIASNYVSEYENRGTSQVVRKSTGLGDIDGEFLRLIDYAATDEFIWGLIENELIGWCIGSSSPTWRSAKGATNLVKAYESGSEVLDLSKYPIVNPSYVSLDSGRILISGHQSSGSQSGIGFPTPTTVDGDFLVLVDPRLDYEVSFKCRKLSSSPVELSFGLYGYNSSVAPQSFFSQTDGTSTSQFTSSATINLLQSNVDYSFRCVVFNADKSPDANNVPLFTSGQHLIFHQDHKYLVPQIKVSDLVGGANVEIFDVKVIPVNLNFSQGQLGVKNVIFAGVVNNGGFSEQEVFDFTKQYLIQYKNNLSIKFIKDVPN
jgi:hypothetical protein